MASAGARAYNGGLGALPPAGSRGPGPEPLVRGSGGPEAESLFAFVRLIGQYFCSLHSAFCR